MTNHCRAYEMAQWLDLGEYAPAVSIWYRHCDPASATAAPSPETLAIAAGKGGRPHSGRCSYAGCCAEGVGIVIRICAEGHSMHPECFYADLTEKLRRFEGQPYICYHCDDDSLDTLYRAIVRNGNLKQALGDGMPESGSSALAACVALAVGDAEFIARGCRLSASKK